jgi:hypothetical protein
MDIGIALLLSLVLLIASPVVLTTDVPRDSTTTITMDAGYEYENACCTTPVKGDLNRDGVVTPADAAIALQMASRGEYSIDADVSGDSMVTSLDALLILQTNRAGCRVVVDEYEVEVADTIPIPIRVEDGVDVGSLDLDITFDPTLLSVKSAQDSAFDCTVINLEDSGSGVVEVVAYQGVNPGLNGDFTVAEIAFEALGAGESTLDLEIITLTDSTPQVNHLDHSISNGTVTICQT